MERKGKREERRMKEGQEKGRRGGRRLIREEWRGRERRKRD
jgi:hypothetical protein